MMMSSVRNPIDVRIAQRMQLGRAMAGIEVNAIAQALHTTPEQIRAYEPGERVGATGLFTIFRILSKPVGYFFEGRG